MTQLFLTAVFVPVIMIAGCGLLTDSRSIILTVASGNQDTLTVGATDTVAYSVHTPWTPVSVRTVSQTGCVSGAVTPSGDITDSSFSGSAFLTGKTVGNDTVQLQVVYHGGADAIKYLYFIVH